jgi:hypothetical protein
MRPKLTYANVTATLALIIAVGGASAFAATQLAKNSVGTKQLKKNSVTTAKIKKQAVTAPKVKNGALTGKQVDASTLGTVPAAINANVAGTANSLSPPENWHEVGTPGEPPFQNSWQNGGGSETVGFYKDREGLVHLKGYATLGIVPQPVFQLPMGYRPASNTEHVFAVPCVCSGLGTGVMSIDKQGDVQPPSPSTAFYLDGITFRAES